MKKFIAAAAAVTMMLSGNVFAEDSREDLSQDQELLAEGQDELAQAEGLAAGAGGAGGAAGAGVGAGVAAGVGVAAGALAGVSQSSATSGHGHIH